MGSKLIESAIEILKENSDIIKIRLSVNPEQTAALKLYGKFGFKVVGKLEKELKIGKRFYNEIIMEKFLRL